MNTCRYRNRARWFRAEAQPLLGREGRARWNSDGTYVTHSSYAVELRHSTIGKLTQVMVCQKCEY